jgi:hypothetical protein
MAELGPSRGPSERERCKLRGAAWLSAAPAERVSKVPFAVERHHHPVSRVKPFVLERLRPTLDRNRVTLDFHIHPPAAVHHLVGIGGVHALDVDVLHVERL